MIFSHTKTVIGCDREINAHVYSVSQAGGKWCLVKDSVMPMYTLSVCNYVAKLTCQCCLLGELFAYEVRFRFRRAVLK